MSESEERTGDEPLGQEDLQVDEQSAEEVVGGGARAPGEPGMATAISDAEKAELKRLGIKPLAP